MRNITILISILACLFVSSVSYAADIKLGVVNIAYVLKHAPQAAAARKNLEAEFAPREEEILKFEKTLKTETAKLAKDGAIMSPAGKKQLERKILNLKRDIKRAKEEFTEDLNIRRNDELNKLQKIVNNAIVSLAEKESFDVIFGDNVMYANKRSDITKEVLVTLEKMLKNNNNILKYSKVLIRGINARATGDRS